MDEGVGPRPVANSRDLIVPVECVLYRTAVRGLTHFSGGVLDQMTANLIGNDVSYPHFLLPHEFSLFATIMDFRILCSSLNCLLD